MFIFLFWFALGGLTLRNAHVKKGKKAPGEKLPALIPVPDNAECGKNLANLSNRFAANANRRFQFDNAVQPLIGMQTKRFPLSRCASANPAKTERLSSV